MALVSIIMAMRNSAPTIEAALRSLLLQTHTDWELILIDDCSNDDSIEKAARYADPRIRLVRGEICKGLAHRLNEATRLASGNYIARFDADDVCYPERLEKQVAFLAEHPNIDVVAAGALVFDDRGSAIGRLPLRTTHEAICENPMSGFYFAHPTWMGRSAWFLNNPYDSRRLKAQDQDVLLRSFKRSRFSALPEVLLGYRQDTISLSKTISSRYHFSCSLLAFGRADDCRFRATCAVCMQTLKGAADAFAISTGLSRKLLKHRALPLSESEISKWADVWSSCHTNSVELCAA